MCKLRLKNSIFVLCFLSGSVFGTLVDQSQLTGQYMADLFSDGGSGQTFTAGMDGDLIGIRLLVEGAGYSAPNPYGSDFQVNLRTVSSQNVVSQEIVATAYQSKVEIEHNSPKWIEILFDQPYYQTEGQRLAFTILELSGGGSNGWNNYGLSSGNPYTRGQQFYSFTGSPLFSTPYDMTFSTLVIPEPCSVVLMLAGLFYLRKQMLSAAYLIIK